MDQFLEFARSALAAAAVVLAPLIVFGYVALRIRRAGRLAAMKKQDLRWYEREYPDRVVEGVTCYQCGSSYIGAHPLKGKARLLRHFCRRCDTTLFYSQAAE